MTDVPVFNFVLTSGESIVAMLNKYDEEQHCYILEFPCVITPFFNHEQPDVESYTLKQWLPLSDHLTVVRIPSIQVVTVAPITEINKTNYIQFFLHKTNPEVPEDSSSEELIQDTSKTVH